MRETFLFVKISTNIDSTIWSNYIVFFDIFNNFTPFISLQQYESIISENPLRFNSLTSGEIGNINVEEEKKDISITSVAIIIFIIIFLSAFFTKSG